MAATEETFVQLAQAWHNAKQRVDAADVALQAARRETEEAAAAAMKAAEKLQGQGGRNKPVRVARFETVAVIVEFIREPNGVRVLSVPLE